MQVIPSQTANTLFSFVFKCEVGLVSRLVPEDLRLCTGLSRTVVLIYILESSQEKYEVTVMVGAVWHAGCRTQMQDTQMEE